MVEGLYLQWQLLVCVFVLVNSKMDLIGGLTSCTCFYGYLPVVNIQFSGCSDQIEVLWSKGEKPLPPLHPLLIKGRNLYRLKTLRQVFSHLNNIFFFSVICWLLGVKLSNCILVVNFRDGEMKGRGRKFWWTSTPGGVLLGLIEKHGSKRRKWGKCSRKLGTPY